MTRWPSPPELARPAHPCEVRITMSGHQNLTRRTRPKRQRGMATLVVVMILFFIVAMVAAYTSRNMIFEQRASANQYRATQALEAAEAGMQWTLAMLNGGRIDAACQPAAGLASSSFRARHLGTVDTSRRVVLNTRGDGSPLMPTCVFNPKSNTWNCACPTDAAAVVPALVATNDQQPLFRVQFKPVLVPGSVLPSPRADVFIVSVVGCTGPFASCLLADADTPGLINNPGPSAASGDAIAVVQTKVTLRSALATPPGAAITAAQGVDGGAGGGLTASNTEQVDGSLGNTSGVTVIAGGNVNNVVFKTLPGTSGNASIRDNDPTLGAQLGAVDRTPQHTADDRMFSKVFGMWPETYLAQPSVVQLNCAAGCGVAAVNAAAATYPGHALWLNGNLVVNGDIGSAPAVVPPITPAQQSLLASEVPTNGPVLLIVNGTVTLTSGTLYGLVYRRATPAEPNAVVGAGTTVINGAFITEGGVVGAGNQTVNYDAALLNRLHTRVGTYVRVPGGWRDF
jgi:Tfp pilus assembly protein PilX